MKQLSKVNRTKVKWLSSILSERSTALHGAGVVDAVIDAEQYAHSRSYNVRFTSEDIRAAGISIFIAARDGGRR